MRLKNSKYQWTGSTEQIGRNTSIDTDSEFDERDLRICLQDQLNNITISDSPRN